MDLVQSKEGLKILGIASPPNKPPNMDISLIFLEKLLNNILMITLIIDFQIYIMF